jgi:hypothetical protein
MQCDFGKPAAVQSSRLISSRNIRDSAATAAGRLANVSRDRFGTEASTAASEQVE